MSRARETAFNAAALPFAGRILSYEITGLRSGVVLVDR
jgi:hypothetical protein